MATIFRRLSCIMYVLVSFKMYGAIGTARGHEQYLNTRYLDTSVSLISSSTIHCTSFCQSSPNCRVSNFHRTDKVCEISVLGVNVNSIYWDTVTDWSMVIVAASCAPGWTRLKRSCYILSTQLQSWEDAEKHCSSLYPGADLADIHSKEVNDMVAWLNNIEENGSYIWTGGRKNLAGSFQWRYGSLVSVGFLNWDYNQPDNYYGDEDCIHLRLNGKWNDVWCDMMMMTACEYDLD